MFDVILDKISGVFGWILAIACIFLPMIGMFFGQQYYGKKHDEE
ncbi:MAG: hypothetical protein Q3988_03790 [Gemella sp.]|nr:hypothetical protein [Gemella sp.]